MEADKDDLIIVTNESKTVSVDTEEVKAAGATVAESIAADSKPIFEQEVTEVLRRYGIKAADATESGAVGVDSAAGATESGAVGVDSEEAAAPKSTAADSEAMFDQEEVLRRIVACKSCRQRRLRGLLMQELDIIEDRIPSGIPTLISEDERDKMDHDRRDAISDYLKVNSILARMDAVQRLGHSLTKTIYSADMILKIQELERTMLEDWNKFFCGKR